MADPREYRYNPLDFEPDVAIGVPLPFNGNSPGRSDIQHYASGSISAGGVFAQTFSTEEQAISNLKNLILTKKGERFMQPDFGTDIVDALFEPNTEDLETLIQDGLNADIKFWLPYIQINEIDVERQVDQYAINVSLHFQVTDQGANQVIKILMSADGIELNEIIL